MHHKQVFIFIIGLIVISLFSVKLTDAKFSDLTSEQKQVYWKCMKDTGCTGLLKDKKYASYKPCAISCMNTASQHSPEQNWCEDSDGTDYFTKGIVKSSLYPLGKEDYSQTFGEITYLIEGICQNNKYLHIQKNCQEMEDYQYKDGICTKDKVTEYWEVKTSSKKLEMANSNTSFGSIQGETFNAITPYIGASELKSLVSGTFSTGGSEYPYNQYLYFDTTIAANATTIATFGDGVTLSQTDVIRVFASSGSQSFTAVGVERGGGL